MKTLSSGLTVNTKQYYKLLDWKDNNMSQYIEYCTFHHISYSINRMTEQQYNDLLKFAKIELDYIQQVGRITRIKKT